MCDDTQGARTKLGRRRARLGEVARTVVRGGTDCRTLSCTLLLFFVCIEGVMGSRLCREGGCARSMPAVRPRSREGSHRSSREGFGLPAGAARRRVQAAARAPPAPFMSSDVLRLCLEEACFSIGIRRPSILFDCCFTSRSSPMSRLHPDVDQTAPPRPARSRPRAELRSLTECYAHSANTEPDSPLTCRKSSQELPANPALTTFRRAKTTSSNKLARARVEAHCGRAPDRQPVHHRPSLTLVSTVDDDPRSDRAGPMPNFGGRVVAVGSPELRPGSFVGYLRAPCAFFLSHFFLSSPFH